MTRLLLPILALVLAACETAPKIIPDTTSDSPIVMRLRHEILNGSKLTNNWGWMLWYLPVLLLVIAWGWKEFFGRKREDCKETAEKPLEAAPSPRQQS